MGLMDQYSPRAGGGFDKSGYALAAAAGLSYRDWCSGLAREERERARIEHQKRKRQLEGYGPYPATKKPRRQKGPQPPSLRIIVYERDGYRCVQCGTNKQLSLDHIRPRSKGGKTTEANLQTLCVSCNNAKADTWDEAAAA